LIGLSLNATLKDSHLIHANRPQRLGSLLKNSLARPQGAEALSEKKGPYRSAKSAAPPKSEFFSKL
jgi:hypothetical protein